METIRGQFGGLHTDLPFSKVASGSARLNVTVRNGQLQKRAGFSEFEDDVTGGADAILNIWSVTFADGDVYLVAKVNDSGTGKLFTTQAYKASTRAATAISWIQIKTAHTLSATLPGWAFLWRDRWHYFDSGGGNRWNPDVNIADGETIGTAYRAGMPVGDVATLTAAGGGEKVGKYHVHLTYRNSTTQEEGIVSKPCQAGSTPGYLATTPGTYGGIEVAAVTLPATYECDGRHAYCTMGNTEHIEASGTARECFSFRAYPDAVQTAGTKIGLNKADHVLDKRNPFTNSGGIPPPSTCGTWTGLHAVYGGVYSGAALIGGKIQFSIPNFPTSVPAPETYATTKLLSPGGVDSKTVWPKPWVGEAFFDGAAVSIVSIGDLVGVYTPTSTYQMRVGGDGRLFPVKFHNSYGCVGALAACAAGGELHAITNRGWTVMRTEGIRNLAHERFVTTLAEIPVAYQHLTSMAYFGYHDQVWAAVVKDGATIAQRILVWDRPRRALVAFDPACLAADEGIAAMCEVALPNAAPYMLVATSAGRLLKYPDGVDDATTDFAASWKGAFAVERAQYPQKLLGIEVQAGDNCRGAVSWAVRVKRASDHDPGRSEGQLNKDDGLCTIGYAVDHIDGRMLEVEFSSAPSYEAQWTIHDIVVKTANTDARK